MVNFASVFIAVSLAVLAAAQSPSRILAAHPGAVMLGSDPNSNWTIAYDRDFKEVARIYTPPQQVLNGTAAAPSPAPAALGGNCRGMSVAELQRRLYFYYLSTFRLLNTIAFQFLLGLL